MEATIMRNKVFATSPNTEHTVALRSAQITKATSYVRKTLIEMPAVALERFKMEIINQ
jgi:hypothetical protein